MIELGLTILCVTLGAGYCWQRSRTFIAGAELEQQKAIFAHILKLRDESTRAWVSDCLRQECAISRERLRQREQEIGVN